MKWSAGASSRDLSQRHGRSYRFVPSSGAFSATVPARVVADLPVAASATIILGDSPATEDVAPKADGAPEPSATPGQRSLTPVRTSSHGMYAQCFVGFERAAFERMNMLIAMFRCGRRPGWSLHPYHRRPGQESRTEQTQGQGRQQERQLWRDAHRYK